MAIHVTVKREGGADLSMRGENCTMEGNVLRVWTEPHEIRAGGLVDPFIGKGIVLAEGDVFEVTRV